MLKQAFIKLHLSILLAGFTGVFGRLISLNEGLLVWYRMLFAGGLMWLLLIFSKRLKKLSRREVLRIALSGVLLMLHWLFFYGSIKYANISVGVVCFALTSFFTALVEPIINRKKWSLPELLLSGLTLLGIAMIFHFDTKFRFGIFLGIVSSFIIAVFTVWNERLNQLYDPDTLMVYQFSGGWIGLTLLMPLYLWWSPVETLLPSLRDFGLLIAFVLFCTILMYRLIHQALARIPSFTVNLSFNLEPMYAIAMAILFFNEQRELNAAFYAGLSLILLSVLLQSIRIRKLHVAPAKPLWD